MKARIKTTGVELEVHLVDKQARYIGSDGVTYWEEDLDFDIEDKNNPDYWTRLEHQAAIVVMQGILSNNVIMNNIRETSEETMTKIVTNFATNFAHALVEKYKKEEK